MRYRLLIVLGCSLPLLSSGAAARAAKPSAAQALKLIPVQRGIEYDQPAAGEIEKCRVEPLRKKKASGWSVYGGNGQILRRFIDTNGDNRIDQWCYYQNGIEVYRDVDANKNGKAEQYRWLGTAGSRWGLDPDEDGKIDRWQTISPEEVTAEVVAAVRDRDRGQFQRVLLAENELESLQLGAEQTNDLKERIRRAKEAFKRFSTTQQLVRPGSQWVHFGATRPGVVPAGTAGSRKDLVLYDHAAAIVETDGQHGQVIIGTLVKVADGWRVIDLPREKADAGLFFTAIAGQAAEHGSQQEIGLNQKMQDLLGQLEKVDGRLEEAQETAELGKLNAARADLLVKLVEQATTPRDRQNWLRQFADTVSAAVQTGDYPKGVDRLRSMSRQLLREKANPQLQAYVKFRYLTADYGQRIQQPNADFAKIQEKWLANLESFIREHPRVDDAADAMLQLAIAEEFAGKENKAARWYARIVADFPSSALAKKAAGAERRLKAVGKTISLQGESLRGGTVDLLAHRGQVVLLHYWATWCEPCKADIDKIRALRAKFGGDNFTPIGINVDHDQQAATNFVNSQRVTWPQLHESGGLDSRLANQLGVVTLPTMLLLDRGGKVVRRNIHVDELEQEIGKLAR